VSVSGVRETCEDIAASDDDKVVAWDVVVVDPGVDVVDPEDEVDAEVVVNAGADVVGDIAIGVGAGDFSVDVVGDAVVVVEETPGASGVNETVDDEVEVISIGAGEAVDIISIGIDSAVEEKASVDVVDESSGVISSVGVDFVDTTTVVDTGVTGVDTVGGEESDVDFVAGAGGDTGVDAVSSEVISSSGCAVDISTVVETSLEVDIVDLDDGVDVEGGEGGVGLVGVPWEVAVELDELDSTRVISAVVSNSGLVAVSSLDIVSDTFSSFLSWATPFVSSEVTSASLDPVMKLTSLSHSS